MKYGVGEDATWTGDKYHTVGAVPRCKHANGWWVTVKFWIFSKHVFVCSDCGLYFTSKK